MKIKMCQMLEEGIQENFIIKINKKGEEEKKLSITFILKNI